MKSFELDKKTTLTKGEKEKFFQQLESDNVFFKETFEVMLSIVISDPVLTYQVADLIESDYRNLYSVYMKKFTAEKASSKDSGCCHEI